MSPKEQDTEYKIKEAARKVFLEKGFTATKTRDIAEEAGLNLALLNYYFRSKKKLFDLIMIETMQSFFSGVITIFNNEDTTLKEKISIIVEHYINFLSENQNVASFIINAIREHPEEYISKIVDPEKAKSSVFVKQFSEGIKNGEIPPISPIHFLLNLMGLVVFPFIVQPIVSEAAEIEKENFITLIQERKRLIPLWIDALLTVK